MGHKYAWLALGIAAVTALFLLLPQPKPLQNSFVLGPVLVFDGEQVLTQPQYVEVRAGLIHRISPEQPDSNATLIDGRGKDGQPGWLLPGLIDAHVHSWGNAQQQQLSFGVTSAVDLFSATAQLATYQTSRNDLQQASRSDVWSAGTLITAPHGHGTEYGMPIPVLHDPAEADAFVAARKAEGSDFIKVVYQSDKAIYKTMPSISRDSLQAVIAAAHRQHLKAVVHIAEQASAMDAVEAGADGLVHSFFDSRISAALLQALKAHDIFVIPTMTVYEAAVRGTAAQQYLLNQPDLDLPAAARAALANARHPQIPAALYQNLIENTRAMHQAGIRLLAGTDAPNAGTYHGLSLILELALLQEAGLSLTEALHCATAAPAQAFALPERGRIALGYRADLLFLAHLQQPTDLLSATVFKNGQQLTINRNPPSRPAIAAGPIADFSHSDQPLQGASFTASSDQMMQGQSTASLTLQSHTTPASLNITGRLVSGAAYPWSGLAWSAAADYQQGLDFTPVATIRFQVRGTAGTYRLLAFSEGNQRPASQAFTVSAEWQWVELRFADFAGLDSSRLSMLLWTAGTEQLPFDYQLEFAGIELNAAGAAAGR